MTDISQLPRWQRLDEVQRKKAQHHLVNAAGLTGLTASGMGGARWMARNTPAGGMRSAPVARAAKIARGSKFGRALGATTAAAGVLGAGSTLTWGASLGREIKRDEAKLRAQNLVKADSWRNHVSPAAQQGHAYLKRGERDKKSLAALPGATGAAGAGLLGREASRYFDRNELRNATGRHIGYSRWNVRGRASGKRALASSALLSGSVALAPAAYRQWKEANRWRDKAGKIEARGRNRKLAAGAAGTAVFGSLGTGIALKRRRERIGKSMPLSEIGKAFAMPRIRIKPLAAPIKRTSPIRRGTFVRTPADQTTYRRGSL